MPNWSKIDPESTVQLNGLSGLLNVLSGFYKATTFSFNSSLPVQDVVQMIQPAEVPAYLIFGIATDVNHLTLSMQNMNT